MITREINNRPYGVVEYLRKLKSHAFLVVSLSRRELKVKYSRAFLGIGWLLIQPLVAVIIYSLFFNYLIKIDTGKIPYIQFVFSGLVLWYIFTGIFSKVSTSLVETRELIDKVAFPRIILLMAKAVPVMLESLLFFMALIIIILVNRPVYWLNIFVSFFYVLQVFIFSFAVAILFSVLIVRIRDFLHMLPFIVNFGIWLTPVFYPVSIVPPEYQNWLRYLNPLAHSIESFRNALFSGAGISFGSILVFLFSLFLLFISFVIFIKFEKRIPERL